jgi:hypothetical protein
VQILGRYLFLETIAKKQNELDIVEARALSNNTRMEYLSFSNYFLTDGLPRLSEWVTASCTQVLAHWPLEKRIRLDDLKQIVEDVRAVVESSNNNNNNYYFKRFTSLMLPPEDASQLQSPFSSLSAPASLSSSSRGEEKEGDQAPKLLLLLNETRNYLERFASFFPFFYFFFFFIFFCLFFYPCLFLSSLSGINPVCFCLVQRGV